MKFEQQPLSIIVIHYSTFIIHFNIPLKHPTLNIETNLPSNSIYYILI